MNVFFTYLTFIPWFLYFAQISKNAIKDLKNNKLTFSWIKKNIFKIFHFETIILYAIFVYFAVYYRDANQIWLVEILLFSAINLYLYINTFYDKNKNNEKIETRDISTILITLIIVILPIIYYVSTKNREITYYILFGYSFFGYLIAAMSSLLNNLIIKIIRKNNES